MFPGCPEVRNGYLYANTKPGLGVDLDEEGCEVSVQLPGTGLAFGAYHRRHRCAAIIF